jgi:hypothetical protein
MIPVPAAAERNIKNVAENNNMEKFPKPKFENFEKREEEIDKLIEGLAEREGMDPDDMVGDIAVFAPYKGNESANPDYIEQVAEMIGISKEEMNRYAIKKAKDCLEE